MSDSVGISCDYIEFSIIIYIHSIEKTRKYDILSLKSVIAEFNSAFYEIFVKLINLLLE